MPALNSVKNGQIVQSGRHVRALSTLGFFVNGKRLPVELLRLQVPPLLLIAAGQIIERSRDTGACPREHLAYGQRPQQERLGGDELPLGTVDNGEVVQVTGHIKALPAP